MKKTLLSLSIIMTVFFLCSCQLSDYNKQKPTNFYYTKSLHTEFIANSTGKVSLFDTNLHKEVDITSEGFRTIEDFIENLKQENFIEKPEDLPESPPYKMFISFNDTKYVIDIFNDDLISIHPWDAIYTEDYMNCNNIYRANNLFKLCKYILGEN